VETFWRRPRSRVSDQENGGVANIGELAIAGEVAISTAAERSEEDFPGSGADLPVVSPKLLCATCVALRALRFQPPGTDIRISGRPHICPCLGQGSRAIKTCSKSSTSEE
jgi:hypothetical protein